MSGLKHLLAPLVLFVASSQAAEFHVCDCGSGAAPTCVPGNDADSGTPQAPWQSYERARLAFATLGAGDSIRFCRGGAWLVSAAGERWVNDRCEADLPCRIDAYLPPGAHSGAPRPRLERTDGGNGLSFADGGTAEHEEGYVVEGLELRSTTRTGNGVFLQNDVDDVWLRDLHVE